MKKILTDTDILIDLFKMRKPFIILFLLIIASCRPFNFRNDSNYELIKRLVNSPDSLLYWGNDTCIVTESFMKSFNSKFSLFGYDFAKKDLDNISKDGYYIVYDYVHKPNYNLDSSYYIHRINIESRKDRHFHCYFEFTNKSNKNVWKLDYIGKIFSVDRKVIDMNEYFDIRDNIIYK